MKTVAHVCVSKGLGGLELYSLQLHEMFKKDGINSLHFCQKDSLFEKKLKEAKLDYVPLNKSGYFSVSNILNFRKAVKKYNIKHIYVHHLKDLWFVIPAIKGMDDIEVIGVAQMFLNNINKKDFLHKKLYGRLKKTMALTDIQKQSLLNCLPLEDSNIQVIPNSVNMDRYKSLTPEVRAQLRLSLGVTDSEKLIGVVGRLDPWKGQYELLIAFNELKDQFPESKLIIIGDEVLTNDYNLKIKKFVSDNNIKNRVIFKGFQSNVHEWMHALDIFVMPSYAEAFGIVLVEAMAAGKPCISTRAGGVPDILTTESLGLLVEPKSSKALKEGLVKYLSDWEQAQIVGQNAKSEAFKKYDMNKVFQQVKSLINI